MAEFSAQHLMYTPATRLISSALLLASISCIRPKPLVITARPVVEASDPHPGDAPHEAIRWYSTFWKALSDLNTQAAWIVADGSEQRKLADAIEFFLNGNNTAADSTVEPLLTAKDSVVRNAARITYGAILTAEGNWTRLAFYADSARSESRDAAGVETWASAYKGVSTTISFADSVSSVPLGRSRSGVPIVPVVVNGVKRYFWLDTGSSITILTSDVADVSHVAAITGDTLELVTSVGRLPTRAAVVKSLKIGGVTVTNARAMIVEPRALQMREVAAGVTPESIDGVIGFDVVRSLDLTIDDIDGRVILRKPTVRPRLSKKDKQPERNLSWYGVPIVTLISETGAAVHLVLDTGAEETFGTPGMATKTHAQWRPAERRTVQGFGGSKSESGIVIPSVRLYLGDVPLTFRRIFLYEARYPTIFTLDGTLGADAGRGGIVRIDMSNGRLDIEGK